MVKNTYSDKSGHRKGTWTPEEDKKLIAYITRYGHWNWNLLPKFAGLERCGKSCRLRWLNYLRPNIKRGNYTQEEDETIIKMVQRLGNRWSLIAAQLPGRTDNEIKNYWHTNLKKKYHQQNVNAETEVSKSKDHQSPDEALPKPNNVDDVPFQNLPPTSQSTDSCTTSSIIISPTQFSITTTGRSSDDSKEKFDIPYEDEFAFADVMNESFWLEPYVVDISCYPSDVLVAEPDCFSPVPDVELWSHDHEYFA
ncbi:hypothetical protein AAZX31_12G188100 [Glycine max]|uniref:Uncharacterized protein n=1 Tax=Glycine max TaxID=3847 RepID=A0A0R0H886_SOYBN|nr:transcription factor MYB4 [Glycine max]KAG4968737.1 hypothetical protein JHK87_034388 [Glycine soja]KAG4981195.1 hypothetical protein JHK85_035153 [Glycine max]KAG4986824.1 hypothetical protein JHK86_034515 [Glycine max]KAG5120024.1 hypothetical protein JHK82_034444 [Glycine max]KAG5141009.1 hypothetical protein JHK84_034777 [Glycine max]|eukprot:XP_003539518.1 transcription factor MYB4 [Glycine max]